MRLPLPGGVTMARHCMMAVLLLAAGLAPPARAQTPLEWKLKKGDVFYVRNVTTTKQVLKAVGKDVPQNSELTVVLGFTVADQTPEGFLLKETVEEVTVKPEKGEPVSDDKMAGATFVILLSPKWEVLKFEGYDKFLDKLAGDDVAVRQALQATLSEDALKKSVRELMAFLPDRPVKEGETWERTVEQPLGALGTLRETRKYKYEGKDADGEKITFTTAVTFTPGKKTENLTYYVLSGRMEAKDAKGTVLFNSAGRVLRIKSDLRLTGTMEMSISDVRVSAALEQDLDTLVEILKENPVKK